MRVASAAMPKPALFPRFIRSLFYKCNRGCSEHKRAHTLNEVHVWLYSLHLRRIRADLRDMHDSHLAMPPMAVPIAFTFCKTMGVIYIMDAATSSSSAYALIPLWLPNDYWYDYRYHWGISWGRVRDSGAAIADRVAAPKGKYNNPKSSTVASRYNAWLPLAIITWLDDLIG